jgi:hypothetical protein
VVAVFVGFGEPPCPQIWDGGRGIGAPGVRRSLALHRSALELRWFPLLSLPELGPLHGERVIDLASCKPPCSLSRLTVMRPGADFRHEIASRITCPIMKPWQLSYGFV